MNGAYEMASATAASDPAGVDGRDLWSPLGLCEALAHRNKWKNKRGGRLDIFRAANWILRAALRGQQGIGIAFWPPEELPDKTQVMAGSAMDRGLDPS